MVQIIDRVGQLPTHPTKQYGTRSFSAINMAVIHHSATTSGNSTSFARHHVDNNDWPGIGYHFVIAKNGAIERTNDLATISYHAGNVNSRSVGILLIGDYMQQIPPRAQIDSAVRLIVMLEQQLGRPLEIVGHRDVMANRTCPGVNLNVDDIARRVAGFSQPPSIFQTMGANPAMILAMGILALIPLVRLK